MTLIEIGLDTTQLCTELIVCDWDCQDFFVLTQKPGLSDFCFVIKIKHQIINAIQCLGGVLWPICNFVFFQNCDVDIKIYFVGQFY